MCCSSFLRFPTARVLFLLLRSQVGHAIGLGHEHKRPDRDQYITVHEDKIAAGWKRQYDIDPEMGMAQPYNYNSIMHYPGGVEITQPAGTPTIGRRSGGFDDNDMEQVREAARARARRGRTRAVARHGRG